MRPTRKNRGRRSACSVISPGPIYHTRWELTNLAGGAGAGLRVGQGHVMTQARTSTGGGGGSAFRVYFHHDARDTDRKMMGSEKQHCFDAAGAHAYCRNACRENSSQSGLHPASPGSGCHRQVA